MPDSVLFDLPAPLLAPRLLGATLAHGPCAGIITETEAYGPDDPASHSVNGPTLRNAAMFGPPGTVYVYRIYGLHWCVNIVGARGHAVLIRAMRPTLGQGLMAQRRGPGRPLCTGPGMLAQALGITGALDGTLLGAALSLTPAPPQAFVTGPRIGISRAADWPHRFGLADAPRDWSRPFPPR